MQCDVRKMFSRPTWDTRAVADISSEGDGSLPGEEMRQSIRAEQPWEQERKEEEERRRKKENERKTTEEEDCTKREEAERRQAEEEEEKKRKMLEE